VCGRQQREDAGPAGSSFLAACNGSAAMDWTSPRDRVIPTSFVALGARFGGNLTNGSQWMEENAEMYIKNVVEIDGA
jgi:hypothetical protein